LAFASGCSTISARGLSRGQQFELDRVAAGADVLRHADLLDRRQ